MAEGKKSFILYCDIIKNIDHLTNEEKGVLFNHLLEYVNDMNPVLKDRLLITAWKPIENQLKRDLEKYENYIEKQKANGLKGGRPKADKTQKTQAFSENPNKPKKADNVNDNENDNENDIIGSAGNFSEAKSNAPDKNDVLMFFAQQGINEPERTKMAKSFYLKWDAVGWTMNGARITNWSALADRFIENWRENETRNRPPEEPKRKPLPTVAELAELERLARRKTRID